MNNWHTSVQFTFFALCQTPSCTVKPCTFQKQSVNVNTIIYLFLYVIGQFILGNVGLELYLVYGYGVLSTKRLQNTGQKSLRKVETRQSEAQGHAVVISVTEKLHTLQSILKP